MNRTPETYIRAILALLPAAAVVGVIFYILMSANFEPLKDVLLILIGALVGMAKEGSGFFMGSSQGSADKTDAMIQSARETKPAELTKLVTGSSDGSG